MSAADTLNMTADVDAPATATGNVVSRAARGESSPARSDWPGVTVIMPVRNEGPFIAQSLGAVLAQDYPADHLEVLVADGQSTDDTRTQVALLAAQHPHVPVCCLNSPGRIVPTGFNAALALARGTIIVRVDGHTVIAPDYVRQCVLALERSGADNVGGRMVAISHTAVGRAVAAATSSRFGIGNARFHYLQREEWVDTVYLGAWPREVFERIGRFDEEQVRNQDDEFNYRLLQTGGRILLSPAIQSKYFNRSTLRSVARQYFQYGYWKVRVMQKHPRQMRWRQFVPAIFVSALLGALGAASFLPSGWLLPSAVIGVYLTALLVATLLALRMERVTTVVLLPVVFPTLHLSYGTGFLLGFLRFAGRWFNTHHEKVTAQAGKPAP